MFNNRTIRPVLALLLLSLAGCAGFHPLEGIPASCLAPELNQAYRSTQQTIDLSLLRQTPPKDYRIDSGDVLAVYVQGVLGGGDRTETPPTNFQQTLQYNSSAGFPIHVRGDGTISLPLIKSVDVRGLTISQVEDRLRKAYIDEGKILQAGRETIIVSLQQPRTVRVLVLREERVTSRHNSNTTYGFGGDSDLGRRGQIVDLPAYDNDVLHALTKSGGLPGLDAEDAVYIVRKQSEPVPANPAAPHAFQPGPQMGAHKPAAASTLKAQAALSAAAKAYAAEKQSGWGRLRHQNATVTASATADEWWKTNEPSLGGRIHEFWASPATKRPDTSVPQRQEAWWAENNAGSRVKQGPWWADDENGSARDSVKATSSEAVADAWWDNANCQNQPGMASDGNVTVGPITEYSDGATIHNPHITRIPIRITPGEYPTFTENDVVLHEGDVVYIESREQDFFYTSGLLGGGQYAIPRDYDLDVLGAMSIVQSQVNTQHHNAARNVGGMSVLNQDVSVGASELIIRRKLADNNVVQIKVNLKEAVRSPENRIFIQPGDYLILQYTKCEACAAFAQRYLLEPFVIGASSGAFFGN